MIISNRLQRHYPILYNLFDFVRSRSPRELPLENTWKWVNVTTTRRSRGAAVKVFAVAGAVEDLFVVAGAVEDLGAIAGAVELLAVLAVNGCRCQMWSWFKFLFFALESTGKQTADE
ncbi:hypothetical protein LWI29_009229 [Acer saccharum]|uniref:Uncharacterized protein n=1 Tax=Acer saccharum TaxID=4024 RepID=A0AA39T189_ACESA|nr:hypothetical protein LWI29_009229 [Acer saccharum]